MRHVASQSVFTMEHEMASVNKVIILGHVGKDPEMRYTQFGDAVCSLTVATSETWKDKATGEKKEATEWHRISFFGRLAEVAGEYLKKGSQVYIEGSIHTRKWTDKDGQDRYTTEIRGGEMKMLGKKKGGSDSREPQHRQAPSQQAKPKQQEEFGDFSDSIPF